MAGYPDTEMEHSMMCEETPPHMLKDCPHFGADHEGIYLKDLPCSPGSPECHKWHPGQSHSWWVEHNAPTRPAG